MTRKQISAEIFERNVNSERITSALQVLLDMKLATRRVESTEGRIRKDGSLTLIRLIRLIRRVLPGAEVYPSVRRDPYELNELNELSIHHLLRIKRTNQKPRVDEFDD